VFAATQHGAPGLVGGRRGREDSCGKGGWVGERLEVNIVLSVAWLLLLHLLCAVNNAPRHLLRSGWFLGRATWALNAMTPPP